ncbi:hypothetical protein QVD17_18826 [Tagetes erecta]|uniref:Transposase-associated domain-containing protein n=1 Tax=Tagetes erecta TaxID=13708 RepID=A0AAD8KNJ3_TARER|nr:hypothetical protein QVD17_18826 [Tagetes erecta]
MNEFVRDTVSVGVADRTGDLFLGVEIAVSHFFNLNSKHSAAAISSIPISSSLPLRFSFNTVTIATTTGGAGSRSSKVWGLFKLPFRSTSPSTPSPSPLPHLRQHRHHRHHRLLTTNNNNHSSTFGTSVLSKFYDVPALDRFEVLAFGSYMDKRFFARLVMAWYTDRGWMSKKNDSHGYLNSEFCDNVDMFLDFAFSNEAVVDTRLNIHGETIREIKCPCYKCQNISYRDRATVQEHLYKEGFMLRYEKWSEHDEDSICDVGQSSTAKETDDNNDSYKRMVLDNMQSHGYTPNTLKGHVSNPEAKRFYDILKAVDEPLWEGEKATKCRKLEAATSFLTWKSLYNVSTAAFNHNLSMVNALLPEEAIGRELSHIEMWKQSHCKKGSRPLDKDLSLLVEEVDFEDVDLDENIEEENLDWVDDRARETWVKYKECLVNKYGKEQCKHPKSVDKDLWIQASGGIKKGKVYGLSNVSDSYTHGRQNPEFD